MTTTIKSVFGFGLCIIIFLVCYQYYTIWGQLEEAKAEAKILQSKVETTRTNLTKQIDQLKAQERNYLKEIANKDVEIAQQLHKIEQLDEQLQKDRTRALTMSNEQDIADLFKATYLYSDKAIVVMERPVIDPSTDKILTNRKGMVVKESVLTVPIDYIKEIVEAKLAIVVCEKQKTLQLEVFQLQQDKTDLTQKIAELNQEKATQFAKAYEEAYASFSTIHQNYVALLNSPPKVDLAPKWLQILGGFLGGAVLCGL